jgi:hypothetical protein
MLGMVTGGVFFGLTLFTAVTESLRQYIRWRWLAAARAQLDLTAKECAAEFALKHKAPGAPPYGREFQAMFDDAYAFCRWVIESYMVNYAYPRRDKTGMSPGYSGLLFPVPGTPMERVQGMKDRKSDVPFTHFTLGSNPPVSVSAPTSDTAVHHAGAVGHPVAEHPESEPVPVGVTPSSAGIDAPTVITD